MLAGKRRLRYQTYGCAYFFKIARFWTKSLFSDKLLIWLTHVTPWYHYASKFVLTVRFFGWQTLKFLTVSTIQS